MPTIYYFTITSNATRFWEKNNLLHRLNGPAVEYSHGHQEWCKEGSLHRDNGPAIIYSDKVKDYYYQDKQIKCNSQKEFEKLIKLRVFW